MDAQYRRENGCKQHLQRHGNPTHEQTNCDPAGYRATVEMPYHGLGKCVANPPAHACLLFFASTQLRVQFPVHGGCVRQTLSEPLTRHSQKIDAGGIGQFPSPFSFNVEFDELLSLVRCNAGFENCGNQA